MAGIIVPLLLIPRSQAIYGSLVETFEPYPRHYTTYSDLFNSKFILSAPPIFVNIKKRTLFRIMFALFVFYSHSIVAGGLLVMSYTTRLICLTSFTILVEITSNTSHGILAQSDVIPSIEVTALIPIV